MVSTQGIYKSSIRNRYQGCRERSGEVTREKGREGEGDGKVGKGRGGVRVDM